jgi:hypothetical protein
MNCPHDDSAERATYADGYVADGGCVECLRAEVERLRAELLAAVKARGDARFERDELFQRAINAEAKLATVVEVYSVPEVWSAEETEGMVSAFDAARAKHGLRETLFAVVAYVLRRRAALAAPEEKP